APRKQETARSCQRHPGDSSQQEHRCDAIELVVAQSKRSPNDDELAFALAPFSNRYPVATTLSLHVAKPIIVCFRGQRCQVDPIEVDASRVEEDRTVPGDDDVEGFADQGYRRLIVIAFVIVIVFMPV